MTMDPFEYDVAISFAEVDKGFAEQLANLLTAKNITVFYDEYRSIDLWGNDVLDHLVNLYSRKARYCVLLVSNAYPLNTWTAHERTAAQERALRDANEYILLIGLDDHTVRGLTESKGYWNLREHSVEQVVDWLEEKLTQTKSRPGPPQSHDLRSGNVPSTDQKP